MARRRQPEARPDGGGVDRAMWVLVPVVLLLWLFMALGWMPKNWNDKR